MAPAPKAAAGRVSVTPSQKVCNVCGVGVPRVTDSRHTIFFGQHSTRRRYRCKDCGARYTTMEVPIELADELEGVGDQLVNLARSLQELAARSLALGRRLAEVEPTSVEPRRARRRRPRRRDVTTWGEPPDLFTGSGGRRK